MDFKQELKSLGQRLPESHKGDYGHLCIIGGGHSGYAGAVALAGSAALRSGAGLVSAVVHPSALALMNRAPAELMCYGLNISQQEDIVIELINKATVILIGPGLTQSDWALIILKKVLEKAQLSAIPLIIDADALNLLAKYKLRDFLPNENYILTPHPGEAARLLGISPQEIQADRLKALEGLEQKWGGTIALKGMGTLVYAKNKPVMQCKAGNPGMATGGMGDVLSGLIGGLVAQGLSLWSAAKLGVLVHAMAGDRQQVLGQRGMLASDLLTECRALLNFKSHE